MEMLTTNQIEAKPTIKKRITQADTIISLITSKPYWTRRELAEEMKVEPGSICAALKKLLQEKRIRIAISTECPTTGKFVACYDLPRHTEVV